MLDHLKFLAGRLRAHTIKIENAVCLPLISKYRLLNLIVKRSLVTLAMDSGKWNLQLPHGVLVNKCVNNTSAQELKSEWELKKWSDLLL